MACTKTLRSRLSGSCAKVSAKTLSPKRDISNLATLQHLHRHDFQRAVALIQVGHPLNIEAALGVLFTQAPGRRQFRRIAQGNAVREPHYPALYGGIAADLAPA